MLYKFKVMRHGKEVFDKNYFGMFFKNYNYSELMYYYRWFKGWINLLDHFLPLKHVKGLKVLEVGCAIGSFAKLLLERGFDVTAIDISEFIIKKAKKLQRDIEFRVLDIEKKVRTDDRYDYIFALEVLEHLENPKGALSNMKILLNRGGMLVFSTPEPSKRTLADPMHINIHPAEYWVSLGKKTGFTRIHFRYAAFIPFFYRFHSLFSLGFPFEINLPFVNNTCFYFFEK